MKKLYILLFAFFSCIPVLCQTNEQTTRYTLGLQLLGLLLEKPYTYEIKPTVSIVYQGTIYTFTPKHATHTVTGDIEGNFPIHYAAQEGDVGDIKTLLSWGASSMSKNKHGETPLIKAVEGGNFRAIPFLFQNGATITTASKPFQKHNPFHYAVLLPADNEIERSIMIQVLRALVPHDRNRIHINATSRQGTPLEIAIKRKLPPRIIRFLIFQGANVTDEAKKLLKTGNSLYKQIRTELKKGVLRGQVF